MKKTPTIGILLSFLTLLFVGCLVDDPDISDDELSSLSGGKTPTGPAADVGGGECLPEEAERGSCNGGGGGTGGPTGDQCTPGEPGCETCRPGYDPGCPGPPLPVPRCANGYPANHPCCYTETCRVMDPYPPPPPYPLAPTATDDAGASTPSVGAPTEGIITDWCSDHPWDARCSDQGGSGGGGGGGGGSGGGNCIPGDIGCHGPVNCSIGFRWNNVTRRCEYQNVGEDCSFDPGDRCIRDITGYCQCLFPEGPLLTRPIND
jgi:hypothetical protein